MRFTSAFCWQISMAGMVRMRTNRKRVIAIKLNELYYLKNDYVGFSLKYYFHWISPRIYTSWS